MSAFLYFFISRFPHFRLLLFSQYTLRFTFHLSPFTLFLILSFLTPGVTFAQQNFQWRNFTRIGDGLSSNNVRTITEDRFGQIWLGTDKGLSRLDGFWHEAGMSDGGPQDNDVFEVFEGVAGFIWVATNAGVYRGVWNDSRQQIDWLQHDTGERGLIGIGARVVTMIQRQNGEIWIGTPLGVNWFDGEIWCPVNDAAVGQLDQGVQVIYEDEVGDLWFGLSRSNRLQSGNLVSRFDGVGWEIFSVNDGLPNGDVQAILEDHIGNLWVGTTGGAAVYDGLTWHVVTAQNGLLIGNNVQSIMSDREATIWIGTTAGVSQFRTPSQFSPAVLRDFGHWRHLTRANSLASNNIQTLFETRTGEIWVGTRDNGVNFSDRSWKSITTDNGLSDDSVTAMLTDRRGELWVGTRNGLSRYTMNGVELVSGPPGNEIRALAEDFRGRIWVGTNAGLGVFDGVSWEIFRLPDINVNSVQSIVVDSVGDVWTGTGFLPTDDLPGLDRYDGIQWERNLFPEIGRTIVVMFTDSLGRMYFGTVGNDEGGSDLWVYDGLNLNRIYSLPEQLSINTILEASTGETWVGTDTGIQIFDEDTLSLTTSLTTTDGLVDNHVQALYRDGRNRIWIGTADGVSLFQNGRFERTLTASEGLNSNNISAITEADGGLWFGSKDSGGVSRFNPEMIPPRTRITDGPTNGEIVGDTSVVFKFEGGDASTPTGELHYVYQLDNGPPTPTDDGGLDKRALLSSLVEGQHRFIVHATDREGNVDAVGASAEFVIDSLAPSVSITNPKPEAVIGGVYEIEGTATDETDFLDYQIRIFPGDSVSGTPPPPFVSTVPVKGDTLYRWNTQTVADDLYAIRLVVRDTPNGQFDRQHRAAESVTVEVDNTLPRVKIKQPEDNASISGEAEIEIELADAHLSDYVLEYTSPPQTGASTEENGNNLDWIELARGTVTEGHTEVHRTINWNTSRFYGMILLRASVSDTAGNRGESALISVNLKNESAKPFVAILQPDGTQPIKGEVIIIGTVDVGTAQDAIIENFSLDYRPRPPNSEPSTGGIIRRGQSRFTEEEIARWNTNESGLPDGEYVLRLKATDSYGHPSTDEKIVTLDNTPPETVIEFPKDGAVLGAGSIEVIGTADDTHFEAYQLTFRALTGDEPEQIPTPSPIAAKRGATLAIWNPPQISGTYELRLDVQDGAGNQADDSVQVEIDANIPEVRISQPIDGQFVSEAVEIRGTADDAHLAWYRLEVRSMAGGEWQEIGTFTAPKREGVLGTWEPPKIDGEYEIRLIAQDQSGAGPVEARITVPVDGLLPQAEILSPTENQQLPQRIEIHGTANDRNFKEYTIEYGSGESPDGWLPISKPPAFSSPVTHDTLALWDAPNLSRLYTLRLRVKDKVGHESVARVIVFFSQRVAHERAGMAESQDGRAKIVFPPNSLLETTIVTVNPVPEGAANHVSQRSGVRYARAGSVRTHGEFTFHVYDFAPEDLQLHRLKPATIEFSVEDTATVFSRSKAKETLTIARWNGKTWLPIGGTIDTQRRTISTVVSMLGRYAITTRPAVKAEGNTIISDLTCQPRVFSPSRGSTRISFRLNRPDDITIKIYNEAGRLRRLLKESEPLSVGGHVFEWDGRDDENRRVVSNFYFVTVEGEGALGTKVVVVQNN